MSKQSKLAAKRAYKFEQSIQKCQQFIIKLEPENALPILKQLVTSTQLTSQKTFKGLGHIDQWQYQSPEGPKKWLMDILQQKINQGNVYDLINISFMLQLHMKNLHINQIIPQYNMLLQEEKQDNNIWKIELGMANLYYQNQQYVTAEKIYLELLEDRPRNQYVLECLAWVYYQFGVKQKVKQYVDQYEREAGGPTHNSRFLRINSLPWNQQVNYLIYESIRQPQDYRCKIKLGDLCPNYYDKLHWYSQARLHDPTLPIINAKMSIILSKLGGRENFDLSFQYADGALELMPDNKEDMFLWYAIDFLNMMAEENPSNVRVVLPEMQLHLRQAPYNLEMHIEMALVYIYLGMDDEAIQFFLRCRRLNPYESSFRTVLGTLYRKKGSLRKAKQCFQSALRLNSCDAAAMMELIMTKIQLMEIIVE